MKLKVNVASALLIALTLATGIRTHASSLTRHCLAPGKSLARLAQIQPHSPDAYRLFQ
jgi:hypothetical protein